jgi:hypothetical protein
MIDLNKEAEEYARNKNSSVVFQEAHIVDFTAGANSKFVKQQILQAQIDVLTGIRDKCTMYELENMDNTLNNMYNKVQELQQKLKQLQDESYSKI